MVGATPQLLVIVFVAMFALFVGTGYYNRAFNLEREARAEEHYRLGRTFADYGYFDGAIEHFGDALLYDRGKFDYRLGLTLALYESGRYQEAELQLRQLRTVDPTRAVVNRLLARLASGNGRGEEAIQYYRTAIYGRWDQNPEQNRLDTRLEFVDFLEAQGESLQLVGELVSLLRDEPADDVLAKRVGLMFLDAGSPAEALRTLRPLAAASPRDASLRGALGKAYFQTGEYGLAVLELQAAITLSSDVQVQELLAEANEIVSLDPNYLRVSRREPLLSPRQRFTRSREVLRRTTAYLDYCYNPLGDERIGPLPPLSPEATAVFGAARAALAETGRPADYGEATERNLSVAADLWATRSTICTNVWNEDDALGRVLQGVAR
ncbi:MAG: tetratricopeptide repeat protein [Acidobacteria bacterium]|nr:tetratricopeptide repeat protein [Acidobacteriota bacterium]MDA1234884.1 tetratricopeptide repeat protein [Acidobacteriota bacterium]